MKSFICVLVVTFCIFLGCSTPSATRSTVTEPTSVAERPTATEVFKLRTKCAELGKRIMAENIIGIALTQSQTSHYNPQTNRCYVQLDVNMADLTKFNEYYSSTVYDGQTGEMLAHIESKKGKKVAFLLGGGVDRGLDYDAASAKIRLYMEDDRRQ